MSKSILLGFIFTIFFVHHSNAQLINPPTNITATGITNTSAVINWQYSPENIVQFAVYYRLPSATTWTFAGTTTFGVLTGSFSIQGLLQNTTYIATVTSEGNDGDSAPNIYPIDTAAYQSVTFTTTGTAVSCTNDNFENNNTITSAASIAIGGTISGKICPISDIDFYRFNNTNSARNIRVSLTNLPTDYNIELYNPAGTLVASSSRIGTTNDIIVYNTGIIGTYRVRVFAASGASQNNNSYALKVETSKKVFPAALRLANPSVNEVEIVSSNNDVTLYPNPTENFLNFESLENKVVKCLIYNQQGIQVGQESSKDGLTNYDMSSLDKGIYTIQLENSKGEIVTKKVIKK